MIELPDHPSPESPPVDNRTGSSLGSRPSTAEEQGQQETSPVNQPLMSWGQSELMGIGIDEVGICLHCKMIDALLMFVLQNGIEDPSNSPPGEGELSNLCIILCCLEL